MSAVICSHCQGKGHETVTRSWAGNANEITLAERPGKPGHPPMEYDVRRVCIWCHGRGTVPGVAPPADDTIGRLFGDFERIFGQGQKLPIFDKEA